MAKAKYPCTPLDPATKLNPDYAKYEGKGDKHWFWEYRGYEIHINRAKCMAGYYLLYSVFRIEDGWEFISNYTDSSDRVTTMLKCMKDRIDDKLDNKIPDDDEDFED